MNGTDDETVRKAIRAAVAARAYTEAADILRERGPACDRCRSRQAVAWDSALCQDPLKLPFRRTHYVCLPCVLSLFNDDRPVPFYPVSDITGACDSNDYWPENPIGVLEIEEFVGHVIAFTQHEDWLQFVRAHHECLQRGWQPRQP